MPPPIQTQQQPIHPRLKIIRRKTRENPPHHIRPPIPGRILRIQNIRCRTNQRPFPHPITPSEMAAPPEKSPPGQTARPRAANATSSPANRLTTSARIHAGTPPKPKPTPTPTPPKKIPFASSGKKQLEPRKTRKTRKQKALANRELSSGGGGNGVPPLHNSAHCFRAFRVYRGSPQLPFLNSSECVDRPRPRNNPQPNPQPNHPHSPSEISNLKSKILPHSPAPDSPANLPRRAPHPEPATHRIHQPLPPSHPPPPQIPCSYFPNPTVCLTLFPNPRSVLRSVRQWWL